MKRQLRFLVSIGVIICFLSSGAHFVNPVSAQAPEMCYVDEYTSDMYGQSVPPAPAHLDKDGDGVITQGGDMFTCALLALEYFEYCGIHSDTEARAGICHASSNPATGTSPEAPAQQAAPAQTSAGEPANTYPFFEATASLHVRSGPSTSCPRIGEISPGRFYWPDGRNADGSWWRFVYDPVGVGWVSSQYVRLDGNTTANLPVVDIPSCATAAASGVVSSGAASSTSNQPTLEATTALRVRSGPSQSCSQVGTISPGTAYVIEGKNAGSSWLQIALSGQKGWVSAAYAKVSDPSLLFVVPQRDGMPSCISVQTTETGGALTTYPTLSPAIVTFVRSEPSVRSGSIIADVNPGEDYHIVGESDNGKWFEIDYGGSNGWICREHVSIIDESLMFLVSVTGSSTQDCYGATTRRDEGASSPQDCGQTHTTWQWWGYRTHVSSCDLQSVEAPGLQSLLLEGLEQIMETKTPIGLAAFATSRIVELMQRADLGYGVEIDYILPVPIPPIQNFTWRPATGP